MFSMELNVLWLINLLGVGKRVKGGVERLRVRVHTTHFHQSMGISPYCADILTVYHGLVQH